MVEDDPSARRLAVSALADAGFETVEASNGHQALDLLSHSTFNSVVLDNRMPGLTGLEVLSILREEPSSRTLPVILVTSDDDVADRVRGLRAGATDYLVKPYDPDELVARIQAHLEARTAWSDVVQSHVHQRAEVARLLSALTPDATPESIAEAICSGLVTSGHRSGVVVIAFVGDSAAVPLAADDIDTWRLKQGAPVPQALARYFIQRAQHGPWLEHLDESGAAALPGGPLPEGGTIACAPIRWNEETLGLFVIRADPTHRTSAQAELAGLLLEATDLAGITAGLLGLPLSRRIVRQRQRAEIEQILGRQSFTSVFQPIFRLRDHEIVGYEALTRFDDGVRPDLRFAEASAAGLGTDLELATMRSAMAVATALAGHCFVSLNVSPGLLFSTTSLLNVATEAQRDIVIELTEHERVDDYLVLQDALSRLCPPLRLAIDDAGSGFASLRHVLDLKPHFMKLDRSWVTGIDTDPSRQALVGSLVDFASATGAQLIAEGIESEQDLAVLRTIGVGLGQGFLLGRPMPANGHD